MRGVWLATVYGLDWPPQSSLALPDAERIQQQQKELTDKLDNMVRLGINTVFFQIKPDASALYHSALLPWSATLTGTLGKNPGYDPLAFMLTEAHRRGLKVHAWLNPYRVSMDTRPATITALAAPNNSGPDNVYRSHPGWIRTASHRFVLDPGVPEVRAWIAHIVSEVTQNYSIDGIQFDDYFYYETPDSRLNDDATFRQYGQPFSSKAEWRRNNTLQLIREVRAAVHAVKPKVDFGISPAGIWRNADASPFGSTTRGGNTAYDDGYADTRQWVQEGLLDYIAPQIYWPVTRSVARYDTLVDWWARLTAPTHTRLYIGVALYKIDSPPQNEPQWQEENGIAELKRQLDLNEKPGIDGTILFREAYLHSPRLFPAVEYLRTRWQKNATEMRPASHPFQK